MNLLYLTLQFLDTHTLGAVSTNLARMPVMDLKEPQSFIPGGHEPFLPDFTRSRQANPGTVSPNLAPVQGMYLANLDIGSWKTWNT